MARHMSWAIESPQNSEGNGNGERADKDVGKGGDEGAADGGKGARDGGEGERDSGEGKDTCSSCSIDGRPV